MFTKEQNCSWTLEIFTNRLLIFYKAPKIFPDLGNIYILIMDILYAFTKVPGF